MHTDLSKEITQGRQRQPLQKLWIVLALRSILFIVDLGVGIWSHSLSLLAASGHLFADLLTIGLTLLAVGIVQRHSASQATLEYRHIEPWVGLLNGVSLMVIALLIAWEAVKHLQVPEPVVSLPLLIAAGLSIVINGLIIYRLREDSHHDLNVRGVFLHGVADAASSVGLILAAVAVHFLSWLWADAIVSLLVALLICLNSLSLVKNSLRLLKHELT